MRVAHLAWLLLPVAGSLSAQAIKNEPPMRQFTEAEIAAIEMPDIAFDPATVVADDYEKYFFFHRPDTSFSVAYADVLECDSPSSGINIYLGVDSNSIAAASAQYGLAAGVIGGAIAGVMMDAIFGSAERRKARRVRMRNCMFFKGYDRYGLAKDLWQKFNFEEGLSKENAEDRSRALLMQARVASGPKPQTEALQP